MTVGVCVHVCAGVCVFNCHDKSRVSIMKF